RPVADLAQGVTFRGGPGADGPGWAGADGPGSDGADGYRAGRRRRASAREGAAILRLCGGGGAPRGPGRGAVPSAQRRPAAARAPATSYRAIAAATEAFSDSVVDSIGTETTWS